MATQAALQRQVDGCVTDIKRHQQMIDRAASNLDKSALRHMQATVYAQLEKLVREANTAGYTLTMPLWIESELRERRKAQ